MINTATLQAIKDGQTANKARRAGRDAHIIASFNEAFDKTAFSAMTIITAIAQEMHLTDQTVRNVLKRHGAYRTRINPIAH